MTDNEPLFRLNHWHPNMQYKRGDIVQYNGTPYECRTEHISSEQLKPNEHPALWTIRILDHSGTITDPIPFISGMSIEMHTYYIQDGKIYECVRDSGTPIYEALSDIDSKYIVIA